MQRRALMASRGFSILQRIEGVATGDALAVIVRFVRFQYPPTDRGGRDAYTTDVPVYLKVSFSILQRIEGVATVPEVCD